MSVPYDYNYTTLNNIQIHVTGCGLAEYDAKCFASTLPTDEKAIVFGTCSFLKEREIENMIILKLLSSVYTDHNFYLLGCDVNNNRDRYLKYGKVFSNQEVKEIINNNKLKVITSLNNKVRIKIQDGCKNNCSYCIIHKLRNDLFSVPYSKIYDSLCKLNTLDTIEEIEFSGVEVCYYYDKENKFGLVQLLDRVIKDFPKIKNITLTALDPAAKNIFDILEFVSLHRDKFLLPLNLAVQSGCQKTLNNMNRHYSVERVIAITNAANQYKIPLKWDIIVGFPGESEEDFNETKKLMQDLMINTANVFIYSPRKGTETYLKKQVPNLTKHQRQKELLSMLDKVENISSGNETKKLIQDLMINDNIIYLRKFSDIVNFVKYPNLDTMICFDYTQDNYSEIIINFLKEYFKDIKLIVNIPKEKNIDKKDFENKFICKVRFV